MIIRTITPEFTDERGSISNLPLPEMGELKRLYAAAKRYDIYDVIRDGPPCGARNIALITSKAGSVRSNHFHRRSSHWCYVVSGLMHYSEREVGADEWAVTVTVGPGEAVLTGPAVEHKTEFPVDTVFISISDMPQTTAEHEADVVRVEAP